jgi:hypothetical protein
LSSTPTGPLRTPPPSSTTHSHLTLSLSLSLTSSQVVIYTDEPSAYATPVINKLDKNQVVPYRLFRPETQYHEGKHVRDLSKLNRDLSQVWEGVWVCKSGREETSPSSTGTSLRCGWVYVRGRERGRERDAARV